MQEAIQLRPAEVLCFRPPFTTVSKEMVRLTNGSKQQPLAFKVKTTAPKQYCVKPNAGKIEPGETKEISIELQPLKEEWGPDYKSKDKFLIQCVYLTNEEASIPLTNLWTDIEKTQKQRMIERKLRVALGTLGKNEESSVTPSSDHLPMSDSRDRTSMEHVGDGTKVARDDLAEDKERRLKEALSQLDKISSEKDRLQKELALLKTSDLTLRQRKDAEQFALSSNIGMQKNKHRQFFSFSPLIVGLISLIAFLIGKFF